MDKADLFKSRLPEEDVEVPGRGTFRVRGLSRMEIMLVNKIDDWLAKERRMLSYGMVDPALTESEVDKWQQASPMDEVNAISEAIGRLSGLLDGADKEAYKSLRGEPGDGVGVLPGGEAGDDGGPDAQGTEQ